MSFYARAGSIPPKRHTQFRRPTGELYAEELFSTKGFESVSSLLYHLRPPTATLEIAAWNRPAVRYAANDPLRNRHFQTGRVARGGDAVDARVPLLGNADLDIAVAHVDTGMTSFYRNVGGDELLFVHAGSGVLETPFGEIAFGPRDFLVVPCGTTWRLQPGAAGEGVTLVVYASSGSIDLPRRFRNDHGQLQEHAPYCERDFRTPVLREPVDRPGAYEVRVTSRDRHAIYTVANHPFDLIGWDGFCYPYAFNLDEYAPITGKLHQPPPAHATFEAPGAAFCAFVPRLFDYHPLAIPVPYNHSNVDCDEVIYYVSGNFMSRRGIEIGSVTLHAAGAPHGPQPGAVEASLGKTSTDEVAIMVDTFAPLGIADEAEAVEVPDYYRSWLEPTPIGASR